MSKKRAKKKNVSRQKPKPATVVEVTGHLERMRLKIDAEPIRMVALGVEEYRGRYGGLNGYPLRLVLAIQVRFVHTLQLDHINELLESGSNINRGLFWGLTGVKLPRGREATRKLVSEWHAREEKLLIDPK